MTVFNYRNKTKTCDIRYQTECKCPRNIVMIQLTTTGGQEHKVKGKLFASSVLEDEDISFKQFRHTFGY